MANKVKITDGQGTQVFPITHESAVLDDNGNSAGQKFEILHDLYEALTQSNMVVVASEDWPLAELEERTIYRVAGTTSYTDYMYDGTSAVPMATYDNATDDEPTPESDNLVKSGGVDKAIKDIDATYRAKLGEEHQNTVATVVGYMYSNNIAVDIPADTTIHIGVSGETGLFSTDKLTLRFYDGSDEEIYNENIDLPTWSKDYTLDSAVAKVAITRSVNASAVGNITLTVSTYPIFVNKTDYITDITRMEGEIYDISSGLSNPTKTQSVATVIGSRWDNVFNDVNIPSGTKFSLEISGDTGLWNTDALTIRVYDSEDTQVDAHNVTYPTVDSNQYNSDIAKISVERSVNAVAVGTVTVKLVVETAEFYNKDEVDNLVGTNVVYVSPDGSDSNSGTKASPFATVSYALRHSSSVICRGGLYKGQTFNFANTKNSIVSIINEAGEKPCFVSGVITESETKVDGYTKVYKAVFAADLSAYNWLFMYGVDDVSTEITDSNRTYVHGRRNYRSDVTRLFRVNSIQEIEQCSAYAWYQDGETLYFSRPQTVDSSHPLFRGYGGLCTNTAGKELHLNGIRTYGKYLNILSVINSEIEECAAIGCFGGYGFRFDNCINLTLKHCEAAFVESNWSSSTGDGFNCHSSASGADSTIPLSTFALIDCWAHDNFNDGYSDHECCRGHIIGGCYEFNSCGSDGKGGRTYNSGGKVGHGGGLTPSHGAHDIIDNAIAQYNYEDGIRYTSDNSITYSSRGTIQINGVVSRNNVLNGIAVNNTNQIVNAVNCISVGNGNYGFYCVADGHLSLFNCKSGDNGGGNVSANASVVI